MGLAKFFISLCTERRPSFWIRLPGATRLVRRQRSSIAEWLTVERDRDYAAAGRENYRSSPGSDHVGEQRGNNHDRERTAAQPPSNSQL